MAVNPFTTTETQESCSWLAGDPCSKIGYSKVTVRKSILPYNEKSAKLLCNPAFFTNVCNSKPNAPYPFYLEKENFEKLCNNVNSYRFKLSPPDTFQLWNNDMETDGDLGIQSNLSLAFSVGRGKMCRDGNKGLNENGNLQSICKYNSMEEHSLKYKSSPDSVPKSEHLSFNNVLIKTSQEEKCLQKFMTTSKEVQYFRSNWHPPVLGRTKDESFSKFPSKSQTLDCDIIHVPSDDSSSAGYNFGIGQLFNGESQHLPDAINFDKAVISKGITSENSSKKLIKNQKMGKEADDLLRVSNSIDNQIEVWDTTKLKKEKHNKRKDSTGPRSRQRKLQKVCSNTKMPNHENLVNIKVLNSESKNSCESKSENRALMKNDLINETNVKECSKFKGSFTKIKTKRDDLLINNSERLMPQLIPLCSETVIKEEIDDSFDAIDEISNEASDVPGSPEMPTLIPYTSEIEEPLKTKVGTTNLITDSLSTDRSNSPNCLSSSLQPKVMLTRLSLENCLSTQKLKTKDEKISDAKFSLPLKEKESIKSLQPVTEGPEIENIDGLNFFCFFSKEEMEQYREKYSNVLSFSVDPESEDSDDYYMEEKGIIPTKTTDITQIKGWQNKYFAPETQFPSVKAVKEDLEDVSDFNENSNSARISINTSAKSSDYVSPDNMLKVRPNKNIIPKEENSLKCVSSKIHVNCDVKDKVKKCRSAFVSDALDNFLRNESQLQVSLLQKTNPNITPISANASILSIGNLRKVESHAESRGPMRKRYVNTLLNKSDQNRDINVDDFSGSDRDSSSDFSDEDVPLSHIASVKRDCPDPVESNDITKKPKVLNLDTNANSSTTQRLVLRIRKESSGNHDGYKVADISSENINDQSLDQVITKNGVHNESIKQQTNSDSTSVKGPLNLIRQTMFSNKNENKMLNEFLRNLNSYGTRNEVAMLVKSNRSYFSFPEITPQRAFMSLTVVSSVQAMFKNRRRASKNKYKSVYSSKHSSVQKIRHTKPEMSTEVKTEKHDSKDLKSNSFRSSVSTLHVDGSSPPEARVKRSIRMPVRYLDSAILAAGSEWVSAVTTIDNIESYKCNKKKIAVNEHSKLESSPFPSVSKSTPSSCVAERAANSSVSSNSENLELNSACDDINSSNFCSSCIYGTCARAMVYEKESKRLICRCVGLVVSDKCLNADIVTEKRAVKQPAKKYIFPCAILPDKSSSKKSDNNSPDAKISNANVPKSKRKCKFEQKSIDKKHISSAKIKLLSVNNIGNSHLTDLTEKAAVPSNKINNSSHSEISILGTVSIKRLSSDSAIGNNVLEEKMQSHTRDQTNNDAKSSIKIDSDAQKCTIQTYNDTSVSSHISGDHSEAADMPTVNSMSTVVSSENSNSKVQNIVIPGSNAFYSLYILPVTPTKVNQNSVSPTTKTDAAKTMKSLSAQCSSTNSLIPHNPTVLSGAVSGKNNLKTSLFVRKSPTSSTVPKCLTYSSSSATDVLRDTKVNAFGSVTNVAYANMKQNIPCTKYEVSKTETSSIVKQGLPLNNAPIFYTMSPEKMKQNENILNHLRPLHVQKASINTCSKPETIALLPTTLTSSPNCSPSNSTYLASDKSCHSSGNQSDQSNLSRSPTKSNIKITAPHQNAADLKKLSSSPPNIHLKAVKVGDKLIICPPLMQNKTDSINKTTIPRYVSHFMHKNEKPGLTSQNLQRFAPTVVTVLPSITGTPPNLSTTVHQSTTSCNAQLNSKSNHTGDFSLSASALPKTKPSDNSVDTNVEETKTYLLSSNDVGCNNALLSNVKLLPNKPVNNNETTITHKSPQVADNSITSNEQIDNHSTKTSEIDEEFHCSSDNMDSETDMIDIETIDTNSNVVSQLRSNAKNSKRDHCNDNPSSTVNVDTSDDDGATSRSLSKSCKERIRRTDISNSIQILRASSEIFNNTTNLVDVLKLARKAVNRLKKRGAVLRIAVKRLLVYRAQLLKKYKSIVVGMPPELRKTEVRDLINKISTAVKLRDSREFPSPPLPPVFQLDGSYRGQPRDNAHSAKQDHRFKMEDISQADNFLDKRSTLKRDNSKELKKLLTDPLEECPSAAVVETSNSLNLSQSSISKEPSTSMKCLRQSLKRKIESSAVKSVNVPNTVEPNSDESKSVNLIEKSSLLQERVSPVVIDLAETDDEDDVEEKKLNLQISNSHKMDSSPPVVRDSVTNEILPNLTAPRPFPGVIHLDNTPEVREQLERTRQNFTVRTLAQPMASTSMPVQQTKLFGSMNFYSRSILHSKSETNCHVTSQEEITTTVEKVHYSTVIESVDHQIVAPSSGAFDQNQVTPLKTASEKNASWYTAFANWGEKKALPDKGKLDQNTAALKLYGRCAIQRVRLNSGKIVFAYQKPAQPKVYPVEITQSKFRPILPAPLNPITGEINKVSNTLDQISSFGASLKQNTDCFSLDSGSRTQLNNSEPFHSIPEEITLDDSDSDQEKASKSTADECSSVWIATDTGEPCIVSRILSDDEDEEQHSNCNSEADLIAETKTCSVVTEQSVLENVSTSDGV